MALSIYLLAVTVLCSLAGAKSVVLKGDSPGLQLLKEVIYEANEMITKENKEEYKLSNYSKNYFITTLLASNGKVGIFNTLQLKGDDQVFEEKDTGDVSVYTFDLKMGFGELFFHYDYIYRFIFFNGAGNLDISTKDSTFTASGTITADSDKNTCHAVLDKVIVTDIGHINVVLEPSNLLHWVLRHILAFTTNNIIPFFKTTINNHIAEVVKNEVPKSEFSTIICKKFTI